MKGMISENYVNQGTVIVLFIHFLIITYYLINTIHFWTEFCYIKQGPSVTSIQKKPDELAQYKLLKIYPIYVEYPVFYVLPIYYLPTYLFALH